MDVMRRVRTIYSDEHKGASFCHEDVREPLKGHSKWDTPEPVDFTGEVPGEALAELFGEDARPRRAGKQRANKKTKSETTTSTGGSNLSSQFGDFMTSEIRLKREAAQSLKRKAV